MNTKTKIIDYYTNSYSEKTRLEEPRLLIELARSQDIILRYLPKPPAGILDIGGAAGVYSAWLAKLGYSVKLIDIVPLHVQQASELSATQPESPFDAVIGDALNLPEADNSQDAVLLMGPLYHLIDKKDRIKALSEAHRVLKPGGFVICAAISRYASLLDGLLDNTLDVPEFKEIVERDLTTGQHLPGNPLYFTDCYMHGMDELSAEIVESGFKVKDMLAVEGVCWLLKDLPARWANPRERAQLLYALGKMEKEPKLMEASAHFIGIGIKS